jgi:hypothetical protein
MKKDQKFIKILYGYIGFALVMIVFNLLFGFKPYADIIAATTLFIACVHIGLRS